MSTDEPAPADLTDDVDDTETETELTSLPPDVVAANRATWTAALRSGTYAQGREALRLPDNTYCCLGVAETVRGAQWYDDSDDDHNDTTNWYLRNELHVVDGVTLGGDDIEYSMLTARTCWWLGLRDTSPKVAYRIGDENGYHVVELIVVNDDYRRSFAEIADIVDDQPADWDGTHDSAQADVVARNARLRFGSEPEDDAIA